MNNENKKYSIFTVRHLLLSMLSVAAILLIGPLHFIADDFTDSQFEKNTMISIASFLLISTHYLLIKKATILK